MRLVWLPLTLVGAVLCCAGQVLAFPAGAFSPDGHLDEWISGGLQVDHGEGNAASVTEPWRGEIEAWAPKVQGGSDQIDLAAYRWGDYTADDLNSAQLHPVVGRGSEGAGGEFFDIEALYLDFEWSGKTITTINWALVTSWNGDPNSDGTTWDSYTGDWAGKGRFAPHIALDFDGVRDGLTGWDYGLVLGADAGHDFTTVDTDSDGEAELQASFDVDTYGTGAFEPRLYDTHDITWWRGPSAGETWQDKGPYAFDTSGLVGAAGEGYFGWAYTGGTGFTKYTESPNEPRQLRGSPPVASGDGAEIGYQAYNWVWEGSISGLSITPSSDRSKWAAYNTLHCGNDAVFGEAPPSVPEPSSMALLALAVGGLGAAVRRRTAVRSNRTTR